MPGSIYVMAQGVMMFMKTIGIIDVCGKIILKCILKSEALGLVLNI